MNQILYLLAGTVFGLALIKGEAISWYRIQEMFRFESFHMFGIFMTAVPTALLGIWLIRKFNAKARDGSTIHWPTKVYHRGIIPGSLLFGAGWALTGACPGPLYVQAGSGSFISLIILLAAIAGTWTYGKFQRYLD